MVASLFVGAYSRFKIFAFSSMCRLAFGALIWKRFPIAFSKNVEDLISSTLICANLPALITSEFGAFTVNVFFL